MRRGIKWFCAAIGGLLMAAAGVSPDDASSNLAAWAERVALNVPAWLNTRQADTWGIAIGILLLVTALIAFLLPPLQRGRRAVIGPDLSVKDAIEYVAHRAVAPVDHSTREGADTERWSAMRLIREQASQQNLRMWGRKQRTIRPPYFFEDIRTEIPAKFWEERELRFDLLFNDPRKHQQTDTVDPNIRKQTPGYSDLWLCRKQLETIWPRKSVVGRIGLRKKKRYGEWQVPKP